MCITMMSDVVSPVCALKLQPAQDGDAAPEIQNVNEHVDQIKSKLRLPSPKVQEINGIIDDHIAKITKMQSAGRVILAKNKFKAKRAEAAEEERRQQEAQREKRREQFTPIRNAMRDHVHKVGLLIGQVDQQIADAPENVTPEQISGKFKKLLSDAKSAVDTPGFFSRLFG